MKQATKLPPGPPRRPFVGSGKPFQTNPLQFLRELQQTYPRMATIYAGNEPLIFCFRPEHVRYCLIEHPRSFAKPKRSNLRVLLGEGLLTTDGELHRQQRRLVQPGFHKQRVESYAGIMTDMTQEMLAEWQPNSEINISQAMQGLTLRIIAKTLFNIDSLERARELGDAFDMVIDVSRRRRRGPFTMPFTSYGKALIGKRILDKFVYDIINERRKNRGDRGDVLSMLLEAEEEDAVLMSNKRVHDHVLTFVAAGHETAQNTMSWTFYLLSQHPDVREKLVNELRAVLNDRVPTVEDLADLPYLEQVINESWRFYPPAWIMSRRCIEPVEIDGYRFPTDTLFFLSQWVLHHQPDIWGDPENFRPERWEPASGQKIPQGAYYPFGGGPHTCIGMPFAVMETKLLLATILQHYTPEVVPGYPVVLQPRVTLRPKYGIHMTLLPTPDRGVPTTSSASAKTDGQ